MKPLLTLLVSTFFSFNAFCQDLKPKEFDKKPTRIEEVVKQLDHETFVFYYNSHWQLVKPVCASITRICKVDSVSGSFKGKFTDRFSDSSLAAEGFYHAGLKEGLFQIYYPNNQLKQKGKYVNNKKTGIWEYYYPNGNRWQTLDFQNEEILISDFWDEGGKKLVDAGNGTWFGYEDDEKFTKVSGEVLNGRKTGTWKRTLPNYSKTINTEKYEGGKLISGTFTSTVNGTEKYKDKIYCTIDQISPFENAENFQMVVCPRTEKNNWEYAKYPGGQAQFYKEIETGFKNSSRELYKGKIQIQMTIDENGNMTNFKSLTNTGLELELIKILGSMKKWSPTKLNGKTTIQPKLITFEFR